MTRPLSSPLDSIPPRKLEATLFDIEPDRFRYSIWRNVSIGVWAGQANLDAATRVVKLGQHMRQQHPYGHSSVVFVLPGAPAPTADAQAEFARLLDPRNDLSCTAIVVEGEGFWASGIRSAITRMRIAEPGSTVKLRVHETIDEALEWLPAAHRASTGIELSRSQLKRVLTLARSLEATRQEPALEINSIMPDE
jgi:hypothetical protein